MTACLPSSDASLLADLHATSFPEPWPAESFASTLALPGVIAFAVQGTDAKPAGFILCRLSADEGEIITFCVKPDQRLRGMGRILLDSARAWAKAQGLKRLFLEVAKSNVGAITLYQHAGFEQVGIRPDYYQTGSANPEDALLLRCNIS